MRFGLFSKSDSPDYHRFYHVSYSGLLLNSTNAAVQRLALVFRFLEVRALPSSLRSTWTECPVIGTVSQNKDSYLETSSRRRFAPSHRKTLKSVFLLLNRFQDEQL